MGIIFLLSSVHPWRLVRASQGANGSGHDLEVFAPRAGGCIGGSRIGAGGAARDGDGDGRADVHTGAAADAGVLDGLVVAGFQLDGSYDLVEWDDGCTTAGLEPSERWSTWDRREFTPSSGFAVSVHVRGS